LRAFVLDGGDGGLALGELLLAGLGVLDGSVDLVGDIFHGNEDVDFEIGRFHFLIGRGGIETVADIVMLGGGILLQLAECYVVICEEQAMGTDERTRTAVIEADGG